MAQDLWLPRYRAKSRFAQCTSKLYSLGLPCIVLSKNRNAIVKRRKMCNAASDHTHPPSPMVHQHAPHHSPAHANHRDEPLPPRWSDATAGLQSAPPGDPSRCQTAWVDCAASLSGHAAQPTGTRRLLPMLSHRNPVDKEWGTINLYTTVPSLGL